MNGPAMAGRVCLVTGATNGIGRATAKALARAGATLLVHGRDADKTEALVAELTALAAGGEVHALLADFASLDQVRALALQVSQRFAALHVLINNAGLLTDHRQTSQDDFELTFAVNHLAPFLLTRLLLERLQSSAPARIMWNSSSAMGGARLDFADLQMQRQFDGWTAYANTKLANMLCSQLLAERLAGTGVVANAFCPGLIDTGLLAGNRDFGADGIARLKPAMRSAADGARTPVFLATAPEAATISGAFFLKSHGDGLAPMQIREDREQAERLWRVSEDCVARWLD